MSLIKFSNSKNEGLLPQLVGCYQDVFADPPWNEWMKCSICGKYWGKKDSDALLRMEFECCSTPLKEFWPKEEVKDNIRNEVTDKSSCVLALCDGQVVGFCWGYPITLPDLEQKLGLEFLALLSERWGNQDVVAYQSEMGLLKRHRGQGIAQRMFQRRQKDFLDHGLKVGVVRTREFPEPSVTFLWFTQKLGYQVMTRYPGDDGRVVLARELHSLDQMF